MNNELHPFLIFLMIFTPFLLLLLYIFMKVLFSYFDEENLCSISRSRIVKYTYNDGSYIYVCQYKGPFFTWHDYTELGRRNAFNSYKNAEDALYNFFMKKESKEKKHKNIVKTVISKEVVSGYLPQPKTREAAKVINNFLKNKEK